METDKQVFKILSELSGIKTITGTMKLQEDLGLDSLGLVTLLVAIEDTFNFELQAKDMDPYQYETVQVLTDLVSGYIGG